MTAYIRPASLEEALSARTDHPDYVLLSGGTDMLVAGNKQNHPVGIIDLFGLADMVGVQEGADGSIRIGASTTYADLLRDAIVQRELPMLVAAAREIGALQIQARGTIGGNIATSSPVGDSLPVLLALDALIEVASMEARRLVPYTMFCTGYRTIDLAPNELIVAAHIPARTPGLQQFWRKVGPRKAQSISKVMVAGALRTDGGVIVEACFGLGAVAATPVRASATESAIKGKVPDETTAAAARAALANEIKPIDDVRSTARYRLRVTQNMVARMILSL